MGNRNNKQEREVGGGIKRGGGGERERDNNKEEDKEDEKEMRGKTTTQETKTVEDEMNEKEKKFWLLRHHCTYLRELFTIQPTRSTRYSSYLILSRPQSSLISPSPTEPYPVPHRFDPPHLGGLSCRGPSRPRLCPERRPQCWSPSYRDPRLLLQVSVCCPYT